MSLFMVLDTPLTDPDVVANAYYSSQKSAYPVSNLYDLERRRKMWRTDGYWDLTGAVTIVFQESAGVNITATLAATEYTTDATFLAAIKTALEAAGVGTYTVERDTTTGRIKITQSVAGGATVFRLMWTAATGLGAIMGFDTSADDTGALTYTADLLRIHTSEWLEWDLGIPSNPSALVALGDRDTPIPISPNATVKLQANHTRNWSSPAVDLTITHRDNILAYLAADGIAGDGSPGYRYWRLVITDNDNPNLYVSLGVVFLGRHVEVSRGCPEFPLELQARDYSERQETESGQRISGFRQQTDVFPLNWAVLDTETKEALQDVWTFYGTHSAFIVSMDPDDVFSTDGYTQVKLVTFENEPVARLVSPGNWSYAWQLREVV